MELAEERIKSGSDYLRETSYADNVPDLSGLSCRWEPLASQNSLILSLLMQATSAQETARADLYRRLIEDIANITDGVEAKPNRSDTALMTCLVFNLEKSEHIHFVDGADGGFTAAAKKMKASG